MICRRILAANSLWLLHHAFGSVSAEADAACAQVLLIFFAFATQRFQRMRFVLLTFLAIVTAVVMSAANDAAGTIEFTKGQLKSGSQAFLAGSVFTLCANFALIFAIGTEWVSQHL